MRSRGNQKDFDEEKLHEIKHHLEEMLGSSNSEITFEPAVQPHLRESMSRGSFRGKQALNHVRSRNSSKEDMPDPQSFFMSTSKLATDSAIGPVSV